MKTYKNYMEKTFRIENMTNAEREILLHTVNLAAAAIERELDELTSDDESMPELIEEYREMLDDICDLYSKITCYELENIPS